MITESGIKWYLPEMIFKLFLCQFVVLRRAHLHNIARRHTKSRSTFSRPERTEISKHGSQALRMECMPKVNGAIMQITKCPEVQQFLVSTATCFRCMQFVQ